MLKTLSKGTRQREREREIDHARIEREKHIYV